MVLWVIVLIFKSGRACYCLCKGYQVFKRRVQLRSEITLRLLERALWATEWIVLGSSKLLFLRWSLYIISGYEGLGNAHHFSAVLFQLLNQSEDLIVNLGISKILKNLLPQCLADMYVILTQLLLGFTIKTRGQSVRDLMLDLQRLVFLNPIL